MSYLGSESWIFEGLTEQIAKRNAELEPFQYSIFSAPVLTPVSTPKRQKRICPYDTHVPTPVKNAMDASPTTEEDLLDCKPRFTWHRALRTAERLLEEANLRWMMRRCPATERARDLARLDWEQVKKAIRVVRRNGVLFF
jgi:hypothetical protein